jgi:uncharacterized protein YjbI with pentapeptide repeats
MNIVKPACVSLLPRPIEYRKRLGLSISALLFAPLQAAEGGHLLGEQSLWNLLGRELGAVPVDEGVAKLTAEFLVHGRVHAPPGHLPTEGVAAGVRLGQRAKVVLAHPPRHWVGGQAHALGPFEPVPLSWEMAFGGPGFAPNPVGMGRSAQGAAHPLPRLELPHARVLRPDQVVEPAGLGPLDVMHPQRAALRGTYDDSYLREHAPGFPPDLDWRHFNRAPQDQWLEQPLQGDEAFELRHLHPTQPLIAGRLPRLRARVFARYRLAGGAFALKEVPLRLTTVWFFPEAERMVLIHQGLAEVEDFEAADIAALMGVVDRLGAPRPDAHFAELLERRLAAASPIDALNDAPLLPEGLDTRDPDAEEAGAAFRMEGLQAKAQRRRAEIEVTLAREKLVAAGQDPDALGVALPPAERAPTLAELPAHLEAKRAEQTAQQWAAVADVVKQMERALDFADAHQLQLADLVRRGPPAYRAEAHLAEIQAGMAGQNTPLDLGALRPKLAQQEIAERHGYLQSAHLQPPAFRPQGEAARQQRETLLAMLARGVRALPEIDLTGADLSGLDLRGIDFSGAWLEHADLRGANVSGSRFERAVLAHADLRQCVAIGADFSAANLGRAQLAQAVFDQARFQGTQFMHTSLAHTQCRRAAFEAPQWLRAEWGECDWTGAQLGGNLFHKLDMRGWSAPESRLDAAQFIECDLRGVDLRQASLAGATFLSCQLDGARLAGAVLTSAVFAQGCSLREAELSQADLSQANLGGGVAAGARLVKARLKGAHLSECDLSGCDLRLCDATGALLRRTRLRGALLAGANLREAVLTYADLRSVDLRGSNLFGAELTRVQLDDATRFDGALTQRTRTWPRLTPEQQARAAAGG